MIVVADTTPLRYLALIARERLLPALYGRVIIPLTVTNELGHENAPRPCVSGWRPGPIGLRSGNLQMPGCGN